MLRDPGATCGIRGRGCQIRLGVLLEPGAFSVPVVGLLSRLDNSGKNIIPLK